MNLYTIYNFCGTLFPLIPAHLVALFCFLNNLSVIKLPTRKNRKEKSFLENFKDMYNFYVNWKISFILILVCSIFVILFSNTYFITLLGSNDLRTMPEGTYCYYVEATSEYGKTYTLPAKIEKINSNYYQLENVYFKNGGYLYFEDNDYIEYKDKYNTYDQNGKKWNLKLTNKKSSHKMVKETKTNFTKNLLIPIVEIFSILLTGISTILYSVKTEKYEYKIQK